MTCHEYICPLDLFETVSDARFLFKAKTILHFHLKQHYHNSMIRLLDNCDRKLVIMGTTVRLEYIRFVMFGYLPSVPFFENLKFFLDKLTSSRVCIRSARTRDQPVSA